jgi:hypothetical protein
MLLLLLLLVLLCLLLLLLLLRYSCCCHNTVTTSFTCCRDRPVETLTFFPSFLLSFFPSFLLSFFPFPLVLHVVHVLHPHFSTGACHCPPGRGGLACEKDVCLNDCSGTGLCRDDVCFCSEGRSGDDCSLFDCPIKGCRYVVFAVVVSLLLCCCCVVVVLLLLS